MRLTFIVNSKIKNCNFICSQLYELFMLDYTISVLQTERKGHAMRLALQACEDSDAIISVGGDGTNNEVLNGIMLVEKRPHFGIIPTGTGNDFAIGMGIGPQAELLKSALAKRQFRTIDVGLIQSQDNKHFFLNVADIGFGAQAVKRQKRYRWLGRRFSYVMAIFLTFLFYKKRKTTLSYNNETVKTKLLTAIVANGRQFGAGYIIAPDAKVDDGLFDIVLFKKVSVFSYMRFAGKIRQGKKIKHAQIVYAKTSSIHIETTKKSVVEADGEIANTAPVAIHVVPRAISFIAS
jgi:YegS/Rv2252/BmrU family lipid kinase